MTRHLVPAGFSLSKSELTALFCLALDPFDLNPSRVLELLKLGADPNAELLTRVQSPLYLISSCPHPDSLVILNALLSYGANPANLGRPTSRTNDSLYPIFGAVRSQMDDPLAFDKMTALVNAGADPNVSSKQFGTPAFELCFTVYSPQFDALQALRLRQIVSLGADILKPPPGQAQSYFETAAIRPGQTTVNVELLRELVSLGAYWDDIILDNCLIKTRRCARFDEFALFARSLQDQRALNLSTPRSSGEPSLRL